MGPAEMKVNSRGCSESASSAEEGELNRISGGTGELDGASGGIGELDGTSGGIGELDGTSRGLGELAGTSVGIGELDGTSEAIGELDGTSGGIGELDGTSGGIGELPPVMESAEASPSLRAGAGWWFPAIPRGEPKSATASSWVDYSVTICVRGCTEEPGTRDEETRNFFWNTLLTETRR